MTTLWRHLPTVFQTWSIPDLTKDGEAKALFKKLSQNTGLEKTPRASCTDQMFTSLVTDVIPDEQEHDAYLCARDQIQYSIEGLNGGRLGELTDSGQGHGVAMNNVSLIEDRNGDSILDVWVADAKTHHSRYAGTVGVTRSGVNVAGFLKTYWQISEVALVTTKIGGFKVTTPDHWVLRLSLFGRSESDLPVLAGVLKAVGGSAAWNVDASISYARQRLRATSRGSETKKFVNLASGRRDDPHLVKLAAALEAAGLGKKADRGGTIHLVPAPFIVATYGRRPSLMPLSSGSCFSRIKDYLIKAARAANFDPANPDPDLGVPVEKIATASWGSHSFRRGADKRAREFCIRMGIDLKVVDKVFGWKEAEHSRDMQLHYDEATLQRRFREAQVTWDV